MTASKPASSSSTCAVAIPLPGHQSCCEAAYQEWSEDLEGPALPGRLVRLRRLLRLPQSFTRPGRALCGPSRELPSSTWRSRSPSARAFVAEAPWGPRHTPSLPLATGVTPFGSRRPITRRASRLVGRTVARTIDGEHDRTRSTASASATRSGPAGWGMPARCFTALSARNARCRGFSKVITDVARVADDGSTYARRGAPSRAIG